MLKHTATRRRRHKTPASVLADPEGAGLRQFRTVLVPRSSTLQRPRWVAVQFIAWFYNYMVWERMASRRILRVYQALFGADFVDVYRDVAPGAVEAQG